MMRTALVCLSFLASGALLAQQYVISTFAGGAPPSTPIAAAKLAIDPQGMASDTAGNLYFIGSNFVFKLDQNGIVTRVAGNSHVGYSGDGGPALNAQFRAASGLTFDTAGNLYVADTGNYRVRKISLAGIITSFAGNGIQGYSGDGGFAADAQLSSPSGLAADNTGNLFIVDGARVRKVSASGVITTVAGNGSSGFSGDGGPAINAQLSLPYAVTVDSTGNLYISDDANLRVRRVSVAGIITTVAGTGAWGFSGDGGPATSAQLTGASGIAVDRSGNVYFSDSNPFSDDFDCSCIRRISPAGIITTLAGVSGLIQPRALAIDPTGSLYIADTGNSRIRKISMSGTVIDAVGNGGNNHYAGDGGPAAGAQLYLPIGVGTDIQGNVYIADTFNNRIREVSPAGTITTLAGDGTQGYSGDGGPAASAQIYWPTAVAADSRGNLYIADHGNSRIRKVSKTGAISTSFAVGKVWGLAVDKNDNLYVPDPDNNIIRKISPEGAVTTVAGNGTHGYSGDGGPATSAQIRLTAKAAIATDREGSLYFSDDDFQAPPPGTVVDGTRSKPRIRKVSAAGNITTVAGNGVSGNSGDGGPATDAQLGSQLNWPVALAADDTGNLFIADGDNFRIRMVSKEGIITAVAGTGIQGYTGDGGPSMNAQLNGASALAVDAAGNLYVADQFNNVVRLLQPVSSDIKITGVTNAASGLPGAISPGEIIVVSGSGLGPAQLVSGVAGSDSVYSAELAGTTVQLNGMPAPLIYTWATQLAVVVPYAAVGGTAQITVGYQGHISASFAIPVVPSAPGVFTLDSTGKGQAVVLNQDSSVNSAASPAKVGDIISLFATGEGETTPAGIDGKLASTPTAQPILPVSVTIGGKKVIPIYAGGAPGEIAGVMRLDVEIPSGIQTGPGVPVLVQVGNNSSQEGVTIAVH